MPERLKFCGKKIKPAGVFKFLKGMMKKIFIIFFLFVFLGSLVIPGAHAYNLIPEFLCETGVKFCQQGRYKEALYVFLEALILDPNYKPALKHIQMLKKRGAVKEEEIAYSAVSQESPDDIGALEREMISEKRSGKEAASLSTSAPLVKAPAKVAAKPQALFEIIKLDESFAKISQPIELSQGKSIIISGSNIQRSLVVEPGILTVKQKGPDELLATAGDIGYTYVHIWDEFGRWTIEFLCTLPEVEGPTYDEMLRREEEVSRNFKLSYNLAWSSSESGRRIKSLRRSSYSWSHGFNLNGETPYGNIHSTADVRSLTTTTDLTYLNFALTDGSLGPFKGFTLQGSDFSAPFSNLSFTGSSVRGVMLSSPAFNKKIQYDAFRGREGGGRYGNLSPGMTKIKNSFLEGFNAAYSPTKEQTYKASIVRGWGSSRDLLLPKYAYDSSGRWSFQKWGLDYDAAFDATRVAYRVGTRYTQPKLSLTSDFRNIDKNFYSITGKGSRSGELGSLFNLDYKPTEKLSMGSMLDVFEDRAFPAEDNPNRLNESFGWDTTYQIDPSASLTFNYNLQNRLGSISQSRYQTESLSLSRRFHFFREISTYISYYHQDNKSYTSLGSSYINDRAAAGLRFKLAGELYYYLNREMNWLKESLTGIRSTPNLYETGLDWSGPFWNTPFNGSFRMTWHDEEDATAPLSFLSGEDYLEGYSELSYRPAPDKEIYGSCRMRNSWADKAGIVPRMDFNFNAGMRYLWDTGVSWESAGNIEGYVFKDFNSDGLRQRDEAPVEGVKIYLGKDKFQVTDIFGYYKFKNVKGRKAFITLDATTLPPGFVVTVLISQEIAIAHSRTVAANFGIISRSEISGLVFEDVNESGQYDRDDKGIQGAVITLEDGSQATTDLTGKYYFAHASTGEHTITLDLNSLPVYYLPQTSLKKEITLYEGVSYVHNIPLKRIKE
jgi:hypothetical protein